MSGIALAAFAQYRGVYDDWATLSRGVAAMPELAAQGGRIMVAEDMEGALAGAVAYMPPHSLPRADFFKPHWPIIRMLVVRPEARGRGIGRRLTEACIDLARKDGAPEIALHTSPAMASALKMYLAMGFVLERAVPDRFGVPYGVYLMPLADSRRCTPAGRRLSEPDHTQAGSS